MKNIDFKSFMIGLLFATCAVLFMGSNQAPHNSSRYQIANDGAMYGYATILDTHTGSVVHVKMNKAIRAKKEYISGNQIRKVLDSN